MIVLLKAHPFFTDKRIESCELLDKQGHSNESYLLVVDGRKYIVRKLLLDEVDRDFEWKVHNLAFGEGITAEPLFFDEELGFMVFEFLEGKHQTELNEEQLLHLARTLQKLHSIDIDAQPIELNVKDKTKDVLQAFKTINTYPKENVLCHNDLNPKNLLWLDGVKFIDWEYARVNDKYFDLACVCVEFNLDAKMQGVFLDVYFSNVYELEKLEAYKVLYSALYEEWFNAHLKTCESSSLHL
jgi:aminoglycoside phosphotransferase (APT) family kinase protein